MIKPKRTHHRRRAGGRAKKEASNPEYILRLYVSGVTPRSTRAILNLKTICEEHLPNRYQLEVVDIYQQPKLAKTEEIIAAPTLVKHLPLPVRRFIGDLSKTERILLGLSLSPITKGTDHDGENDAPIPHTPRF
jgi:circadian clock protein KaiB